MGPRPPFQGDLRPRPTPLICCRRPRRSPPVPRRPRPPRWGGTIAGWELTRPRAPRVPDHRPPARRPAPVRRPARHLPRRLPGGPRPLQHSTRAAVQTRLSAFGQEFPLTLAARAGGRRLRPHALFVAGAIVEETDVGPLEFLRLRTSGPGDRWASCGPGCCWCSGSSWSAGRCWRPPRFGAGWTRCSSPWVPGHSGLPWAIAGIIPPARSGPRRCAGPSSRSYFWSAILALTLPVITCPFSLIYGLANAHSSAP